MMRLENAVAREEEMRPGWTSARAAARRHTYYVLNFEIGESSRKIKLLHNTSVFPCSLPCLITANTRVGKGMH